MSERRFVEQFMSSLIKLPCIYPIKAESLEPTGRSAGSTLPPNMGSASTSASDKEMKVIVKTLRGSQHHISFEPENSIYELKCLLEPMVNVPAEEQRLILKGKALQNERALSHYMSEHEQQSSLVIHLVEKPIPSA